MPDVLRIDEKFLPEHNILNCCGVIMTTNHKLDGIYFPADDRRHFVAWSSLTPADFEPGYWRDIYGWYNNGGIEHVVAYLATLDLSGFDPKAPPPKTPAFWEIVAANQAPEDAELADALGKLPKPVPSSEELPDTVTISELAAKATADFAYWLTDRRNSRQIPHRLEACGYVAVRNEAAGDGLWAIGGKRQVIYAKATLPLAERIAAAQKATAVKRGVSQ